MHLMLLHHSGRVQCARLEGIDASFTTSRPNAVTDAFDGFGEASRAFP